MKSQKYRATIVSIEHLNKSFEVKVTSCSTALETGDNGSVLLLLPKGEFNAYFEVDDVI
tara:strand:- start:2204 stop:2380 length:177 start_codon:yes stop_codon:yes gene_type:complete